MYLSITTDLAPATDLGYLLMKHPERVHRFELPFGTGTVFFPEATDARCEAVLTLDLDPVALVRGRGDADGLFDHYVNDRPYAASSLLCVAMNRAYRSAMAGNSKDRPELARTPIPLVINICPMPAVGGEDFLRALFEPLGWTVTCTRIELAGEASRYFNLTLQGTCVLAEALTHLYVLIPVLDDEKHYWVGDDEVAKLLRSGGTWLANHPAKDQIALRYLKRRRLLARDALARLEPEIVAAEDDAGGSDGGAQADAGSAAAEETPTSAAPAAQREVQFEAPLRLADARRTAVCEALVARDAKVIADLGCGEGRFVAVLAKDRRFERIYGLDASSRALEIATERLKLNTANGPKEGRVRLLHGALTYRDKRWADADAACLLEVIEHLDPDRLPALEKVVFGVARLATVVVTTPNREHNVLYPTLAAGTFRHADHRFEWTRAEFAQWVERIGSTYGYDATVHGVGVEDENHGTPTQMAVFTRAAGNAAVTHAAEPAHAAGTPT